ncbi:torsin-1A-like [Protopterus annectens]|uniref:torsin-1A-like n=1 Tax=Protopterus annectens TaxID=7888 RepID=UPI001CFBF5D4|nr:torsin-1A-like [Protopterus annectens]
MQVLGITLVFLIHLPSLVLSVEPLTIGIGAGLGIAFYYGRCYFMECCNTKNEINTSNLQNDLEQMVFGQHLATAVVQKAVSAFMKNKDSPKPLTLSFHGLTGTGKTFISKIIANNMYEKGIASKFVHLFDTALHFPHKEYAARYKEQLQEWIRGNVTACPRSMFIFSEMDQMPHGVIDALSPFLKHRDQIDGVSYRKAIFIFISNSEGEYITEVALNVKQEGKRREDIELNSLENSLRERLFNNKNSGFWNSMVLKRNLIDYFVPFLPLEFQHVVMCVNAELKSRGYPENKKLATRTAEELSDFPKDSQIYSSKGCKTVSAKLTMYL